MAKVKGCHVGDKHGYWTIIEDAYTVRDRWDKTIPYVKCRCDCGTVRVVRWHNVRSGHVQKCSVDCTAYINDVASKMPKSEIKTIDQWLAVFNNDMSFVPDPAPEATDAAPGSIEKIEVMRRRLERGQQLFNPNDATNAERERGVSHPDLKRVESQSQEAL